MEEKCLECKWCEVIEQSGNGFIGKSIFQMQSFGRRSER